MTKLITRKANGQFAKGHTGNPNGRPNKAAELGEMEFAFTLQQAEPATECEVRERFRILNEAFGLFDVLLSQEAFPDLVLRAKNGKVIRAEVETRSIHFQSHRHDPKGCDLIMCWTHNWEDSPLPAWPIAHLWYAYKQMSLLGAFELAHVSELLESI